MIIHANVAVSTAKSFCLMQRRRNGKTGRFSGKQWNPQRKQKTAVWPESLLSPCRLNCLLRIGKPCWRNLSGNRAPALVCVQMLISTTPTVTTRTAISCLRYVLWMNTVNGRPRHKKNTSAAVARKNRDLLQMNSKLLKHRAGRSNICISTGRKRSIYPRQKRRNLRDVSEPPRHPKAPDTGVRILFQPFGTVRISCLPGEKAGRRLSTMSRNATALRIVWTAAATLPEG